MTTYEGWSLVLQMIGAAFVGGSIIYAARSLRVSEEEQSRQRCQYTIEHVAALEQALQPSIDAVCKIDLSCVAGQHIDSATEFSQHAERVLDTFEELALGIEQRVYDDEVANRNLRFRLVKCVSRLEQFIDQSRAQLNSPALYEDARSLSQRWSR